MSVLHWPGFSCANWQHDQAKHTAAEGWIIGKLKAVEGASLQGELLGDFYLVWDFCSWGTFKFQFVWSLDP